MRFALTTRRQTLWEHTDLQGAARLWPAPIGQATQGWGGLIHPARRPRQWRRLVCEREILRYCRVWAWLGACTEGGRILTADSPPQECGDRPKLLNNARCSGGEGSAAAVSW